MVSIHSLPDALPSALLPLLFFLPLAAPLLSIVGLLSSSQLHFVLAAAQLPWDFSIFGQPQLLTLSKHAWMGWFLSGAGHTLSASLNRVCFLYMYASKVASGQEHCCSVFISRVKE